MDQNDLHEPQQNYYQAQPTQPVLQDPPKKAGSPTVALVMGILAIVASCTGIFSIAGIIFGIIGVVHGSRVRKGIVTSQESVSQAGFILSIIGLVLSALALVLSIVAIGFAYGMLEMILNYAYYW